MMLIATTPIKSMDMIAVKEAGAVDGRPYSVNAERIARWIEDRCPQLRSAGQHFDFRPGGGAEKICGGVMFKCERPAADGRIAWPEHSYADGSGPITFKVAYGGWEKCIEGIGALMGLQIEFTVQPPGEGPVWKLSFTLPQDWTRE